MGDMKAETNRGRSYIAIDDLGDLLRDHRAQMGSLQQGRRRGSYARDYRYA